MIPTTEAQGGPRSKSAPVAVDKLPPPKKAPPEKPSVPPAPSPQAYQAMGATDTTLRLPPGKNRPPVPVFNVPPSGSALETPFTRRSIEGLPAESQQRAIAGKLFPVLALYKLEISWDAHMSKKIISIFAELEVNELWKLFYSHPLLYSKFDDIMEEEKKSRHDKQIDSKRCVLNGKQGDVHMGKGVVSPTNHTAIVTVRPVLMHLTELPLDPEARVTPRTHMNPSIYPIQKRRGGMTSTKSAGGGRKDNARKGQAANSFTASQTKTGGR